MLKRTIAVSAATAALFAGPLAAAPASAQPVSVNLPCEVFADPYDYPCGAAESTANFAIGQAWDAIDFVVAIRDEAGEVVFRAYCTVFPNQPECA